MSALERVSALLVRAGSSHVTLYDEQASMGSLALADLREVVVLAGRTERTEAELRKRPWVEGMLILQGEHEADVGVVGVVVEKLQQVELARDEAEARLYRVLAQLQKQLRHPEALAMAVGDDDETQARLLRMLDAP